MKRAPPGGPIRPPAGPHPRAQRPSGATGPLAGLLLGPYSPGGLDESSPISNVQCSFLCAEKDGHTYIYIYVYIYMYICIYIYKYIHRHGHMYVHGDCQETCTQMGSKGELCAHDAEMRSCSNRGGDGSDVSVHISKSKYHNTDKEERK